MAMGVEVCAPGSAGKAYEELLLAAPDGSGLEVQARRIADEARAHGTFDSDDTIVQLDDLARDSDYVWDCREQVYRHYVPEADPSEEDEPAIIGDQPVNRGDEAERRDAEQAFTWPEAQSQEEQTGDPPEIPATMSPTEADSPSSRPRVDSTPRSPDRTSGVDTPGSTGSKPVPPAQPAAPDEAPRPALTVSAAQERDGSGAGRLPALVGGVALAAIGVLVMRRNR